ncbi:SDR family oxidoreductase [Nitrosopumilus ureiphilus]|uniref:dTDP-4-dehydrorhamnose reductase n=1 Tax=Nitrosopumilus ureiphilus TaxID=1470067 RepID=A0A7D5M6S6_9ARCH|nr:SDR family oxidoreductase [Nitrosopumilus ureiphilus]QLH05768.1 dTDP-4-dehydrorhamnose reductase [Nitrosopumilus ureiphilus]
MNKKRMLVVGGSSLLGYKLLENGSCFELYSTYNKNLIVSKNTEIIKINIVDEKDCQKILELKPDIIVNAAAMTNVDYCEQFREEAYEVNVIGTKNLAKIAQQLGSKFIHISTDAVFSGEKNQYVEDDEPNPVNIYGKTKLESEKIASEVSNYLILRPSVLFGWMPSKYLQVRDNSVKTRNFALWILKKLNEKQKLSIVDDQFSTPTLADNLAENIIELIKKDMQGVFHTSGLSCINRLDFSKKIAKTFGYLDNFIVPCSSKELKQIAIRPLQSCLNCEKIVKKGIKLLEIEQAIEIMHNQIKKEEPELIGETSEKK